MQVGMKWAASIIIKANGVHISLATNLQTNKSWMVHWLNKGEVCFDTQRNCMLWIEQISIPNNDRIVKECVCSDAGALTCLSYPGSRFNEQKDAELFASFEVDYLKYDNCYSSEAHGYPDADRTSFVSLAPRFQTMRDALHVSGRETLYSVCEWYVGFLSSAKSNERHHDLDDLCSCWFLVQGRWLPK